MVMQLASDIPGRRLTAHQSPAWQRARDPAFWLMVGVATPYAGILGYFTWQIAGAIGLV
jgi:hypothetical protein